MRVCAFLLLFFCLPCFAAQGRSVRLVAGGGLSRDYASIGTSSRFEGWGSAAEGGIEIPIGRWFGTMISGEYRHIDLSNTRADDQMIENASLVSTSGRLGFLFGPVVVGGGMGADRMRIKQVSTATGSSVSVLTGKSILYFLGVNLELNAHLRLALEAQHRAGEFVTYKFQDTGIGMKLLLMF